MNKKAWNWTGSTEFEMGGNPPDNHMGTSERSDMLSVNGPNSQNVVTTERTDGITAPIQSDSDDVLKVDVINDQQEPIASFACNVASTYSDKVLGLQKYNSLLETAGLLFPYSRPQDLIYHMGTVKFPIDIIFADSSNKIKKIYKNIAPGTLGTFSCAGSKNVLEICGGLSDRLGLDVGNEIIINKYSNSALEKASSAYSNHHKKCIFKYSSLNKVNQWKDFPIVNVSKDFKKIASAQNINFPTKKLLALDIDHTIFENGYVNTFNVTANSDGFDHNVLGDSVNVIDFDSIKHISEITNGFNILADSRSLDIFLNNDDSKQLIKNINKEKEIILLTRFENADIIKIALEHKLPNSNINIIKISENYDLYNAIDLLQNKFSKYDVEFYSDEQTVKLAGVPIPDEVKNYGKKVVKILLSIQEMVEESIANISQNMTEYDQHKDNVDLIKNSKGQLFQSNRKNNQIIRTFLVKTRDAIRILNKIKDASTTLDIIEAMTISGKDVADHAEEVFDMIDQIDSPEFAMLLMEKSKKYIKFSEDFNLTLKRAIDYINKDILGLIILSE